MSRIHFVNSVHSSLTGLSSGLSLTLTDPTKREEMFDMQAGKYKKSHQYFLKPTKAASACTLSTSLLLLQWKKSCPAS